MAQDRPLLGISFMIGFCIFVPFSDAFAKLAGASLPLLMLMIARLVFQAFGMSTMVLARGGSHVMTRRIFLLTVLRSALNIGGLSTIYLSFRFLPLADAIAIAYVLPFIQFFLGYFILGETVGPLRVVAALIGFCGTLMVVQPSFAVVGWPALLPVLAAVIFAAFILVTRVVAQECDGVVLQAVSGWVSLALLIPVVMLGAWGEIGDLQFQAPQGVEWAYLAGIGVFGTLSHLLMVLSLTFAPSATVAPIQYLEIPVAAVLGWLIFREFPNGLALVGIVVILAAGLFILWRERAAERPEVRQAHQAED